LDELKNDLIIKGALRMLIVSFEFKIDIK